MKALLINFKTEFKVSNSASGPNFNQCLKPRNKNKSTSLISYTYDLPLNAKIKTQLKYVSRKSIELSSIIKNGSFDFHHTSTCQLNHFESLLNHNQKR